MTQSVDVAIPFPTPEIENRVPPTREEVERTVRAVAAAASPTGTPDGLTPVQRAVLNALVDSMTGVVVDAAEGEPLGPDEFGEAMRLRSKEFRIRMVQMMLLAELLLVPLPVDVTERVESYARRLGVCDQLMRVARRLAHGSLGLALIDFKRSGYFQQMAESPSEHLHTSTALGDAWLSACNDPELHQRWVDLEHCPEGSLGVGVWQFYKARGFTFPGRLGSAPPALAQHDWVHVLAGYGSTVECEIEVFGLISRANDDPGAFSLLAMVLGLFETGYFFDAANGFFEYDRGHISRDPERMAARLADAMFRGAKLAWFLDDNDRSAETDLLATDWFAYADWPVEDVRSHLGLLPKSERTIDAGSVSPWEPGGMSPYQYKSGPELAAAEGREYSSYGALPPDD
jgi:transposase-like protein